MRASLFIAWLITLVAAQNSTNGACYWRAGGMSVQQPADKWGVCTNSSKTPGGASTCCYVGSECGEDNLCHWPDSGGKSWFIGGCTDGSWTDPACPMQCTDFENTYAQYNTTDQLWYCCGADYCTGPVTNETFQAVSPQQWTEVSIPGTASSSSPSPSVIPNNSSNSTSSHTGHGLSGGAIAGIVVACVVVGLGILATAAVLLRRRWQRTRAARLNSSSSAEDGLAPTAIPQRQMTQTSRLREAHSPVESDGASRLEIDGSPQLEIDGMSLVELEARGLQAARTRSKEADGRYSEDAVDQIHELPAVQMSEVVRDS